MTKNEVMDVLYQLGNEGTKSIYLKHGAKEPFFGVKVGDLKTIQKKVKKDHDLALELYATGNSDAMYLAGLIADNKTITKETLQEWVKQANWYMLSEYTVAWIASESKFGWELGLEWINDSAEGVQSAGWSTLSNYIAITADDQIDIKKVEELLDQVNADIHESLNRVRYTKNGFVISVGSYIPSLTEKAMEVAKNIGKVSVNVGDTSCKVPLASDYIQKIIEKDRVGKKKKKARC
ncbi:DNA alkylation repair protein [Flammeovirga sp. EKP202]|uniref:DNA alkylation repair protein n=1 Tax=Flammeovirga sp. EKP202 TaxID=2770592 RepID=UPI00165F54F9|nr:DNA alkylation repair protein [Flammeovirga sp. EKP202]MBD0400378.1 DNA alkylation repair protein [Flammeovirga sp. EKP202]